uniref:Uncharacterized protein n=1 Tax=viral metagenome TaxID=1070528 RepID=A0A6C0CLV1_9ZZZZ
MPKRNSFPQHFHIPSKHTYVICIAVHNPSEEYSQPNLLDRLRFTYYYVNNSGNVVLHQSPCDDVFTDYFHEDGTRRSESNKHYPPQHPDPEGYYIAALISYTVPTINYEGSYKIHYRKNEDDILEPTMENILKYYKTKSKYNIYTMEFPFDMGWSLDMPYEPMKIYFDYADPESNKYCILEFEYMDSRTTHTIFPSPRYTPVLLEDNLLNIPA